ncbi:hypothetical protein [Undibacterium rugosum]|uniref:Uncharacterized protein n=1 Tax=Undibacterium rugosum TaxID=2762291 RepID=A0A923KZ97_9BURK|nr:hypothetical protein [Undibacterium rugosum]MBC3935705.1 hypothetical protein [Undibacterium rugosum]MBR7778532.1 hypothetical protein [Undibacterium rugosum]
MKLIQNAMLEWMHTLYDAIRDKYFLTWFIPMLSISALIVVVLFDLMGYDHSFKLAHLYTQNCRSLNDKEALAMLLTAFVTGVSCILLAGELIIFAEGRKRGVPTNYTSFISTSCVALISLTLIFIFSREFCH